MQRMVEPSFKTPHEQTSFTTSWPNGHRANRFESLRLIHPGGEGRS